MTACATTNPIGNKKARTATDTTAESEPVYYTAKELAVMIRVDDFRTIYKMVAAGKIPRWCVTKIGKRTLFKKTSVEKWLAENTGT